MSLRLRCLLTSGVVAILLGVSALPADAQTADPSCAPADQAQLTVALSADGHEATFTVGNAMPLCEPMQIGLAVYLKDADGFVVPQALVDSATDTITTGSKVLSVTLPTQGTAPRCFTQVDAFTGAPLHEITDTQQYGPRLLAYQWGEVSTCGEVEAESTTTSTSTTATTIHTNDTKPPGSVEGTQISRTPATVQSQPLARTGPSTNIGPLIIGAGLLLMLGGLLLAWSSRPA
ncbi:MAG: hypothetical protein QOI95_2137 [Acidimicrobiaceae bacterium]|jgi:hypothetical protein